MAKKLKIGLRHAQTIREAFDGFLLQKKALGLADKTIETYSHHFAIISKYLDSSAPIAGLFKRPLDEMIERMRSAGMKDIHICKGDNSMSSNSDQAVFEISNGELVKYHGNQAVIYVPDGVVRIGEGAFTRPITVLGYGGPPPMCSWDGMETSAANVGTHEEPGGFEFIREVYLPESVEIIGPHAFQGCTNLERIHMPSRLRSIGEKAFARCYSMKQIEVPVDTIIEYQAFYMAGIKVIRVPKR